MTNYASLREGYVKAAEKLLKMPLCNPTLRRLQVLDPALVRHKSTTRSLKVLAKELPNVISEKDQGQLAMEASTYSTDPDVFALSEAFDEDKMRIDSDFWKKVFELKRHDELRYGALKKLIVALLSIFAGPLIEATFNIMDDIVEKDRASMSVDTYESIAIVKTALKRKQETALTMKVTTDMKRSCINAYGTYRRHLKDKKEALEKKTEGKLQSAVIQMRKEKAKRIAKLIKLQQQRREQQQCRQQQHGVKGNEGEKARGKKDSGRGKKDSGRGRFKRIRMME